MIFIIYVSVAAVFALAAVDSGDKKNMLLLHLKGGEEVVKEVVRDVGLTYKDKRVLWAKQQLISKRSIFDLSERDAETFDDEKEQAEMNVFLNNIKDTKDFQKCKTGTFACTEFPSHLLNYLKHLGQTDVAKLGTISTDPAPSTTLTTYQGTTKHMSQSPKQLSAYAVRYSDPNWRNQWFMQDYRTTNYPVMDHNIVPVAFKDISHLAQDLTGDTVTVGVLGDGVTRHPDLGDNYVESISYSFCSATPGSTPNMRFTGTGYTFDTVGTSSAGVIAMKANNELCGVGIAPKAKIAGLRMAGCDSPVKDIEASALKYNLDKIDIYCNSWTTNDDRGTKLIPLSNTAESALKLGVSEGRGKKGAIYVFPSGSSKLNNCAANGYVNNPYGIAIASASSNGKFTIHSERCSAVFATAYSSDMYANTEIIPTISANGGCAKYPVNKPAGPAVAAGIFALVLQYKPDLTYRDMMHLITMTAEVAPLADNRNSWYRNGRGLWVSHDFGFGLLNAKNMINLAKDWKTVPKKNICVLHQKFDKEIYFDNNKKMTITFDGNECNAGDKKINYLEHVELLSNMYYIIRGAVHVNITSPAGTNTELLRVREKDYYNGGFLDWNIMSVHNWGENPHGTWHITYMACLLRVEDNPYGYIRELTFKLHGTEEMPVHYKKARKYAAFRLPDGSTN